MYAPSRTSAESLRVRDRQTGRQADRERERGRSRRGVRPCTRCCRRTSPLEYFFGRVTWASLSSVFWLSGLQYIVLEKNEISGLSV